jgi:hypothetical protein
MSETAQKSLNAYAGYRRVIIGTLCSTEFLGFLVHPYALEAITADGYPEVAVWVAGLQAVAFAQAGAVVSVVAALAAAEQDGVGEQAFSLFKVDRCQVLLSGSNRGRHATDIDPGGFFLQGG